MSKLIIISESSLTEILEGKVPIDNVLLTVGIIKTKAVCVVSLQELFKALESNVSQKQKAS
jgi:hypothetical protein